MTQYVQRTITTDIEISPGDVLTYRLPTMMPGAFSLATHRLAAPPVLAMSPADVGVGVGIGVNPGIPIGPIGPIGPGPVGPVNPPIPIGPGPLPSYMLMDLLHGGVVVASAASFPDQATASDGDGSWSVRLHLAPDAPAGVAQGYSVSLDFPSMLPVLTRRIPLSYLRQGFNDNWNGRQYVFAEIDQNTFSLSFDPELATYYNLKDTAVPLNIPVIKIDNVLCDDIALNVGYGPSPFDYAPGDLPYIQINIPVQSADGTQPITVDLPVVPDITLANFYFRFTLYLMVIGDFLTYSAVFESDLVDKIPNGIEGHLSLRDDIINAAQNWINGYGQTAGVILTTWFLGGSYDAWSLQHDLNSTQPDKFGIGDIVFDYIGLEAPPAPPGAIGDNPPPPPNTDPPLFNDPYYVPLGAGTDAWLPPQPPAPPVGGEPGSLPTPTTEGDLSKISNIVVVMMENRSFDQMLGYLSRDGGRTDIDGLIDETGAAVRTQFNYYNGQYYYPEHLDNTQIGVSPIHSHENVKGQMCDGMGHFCSDYARLVGDTPAALRDVMGYYGPELATYAQLAKEFAVCDHWFCSHVGPTIPNRFVTLTGDLNRDAFGQPEVDTPDYKTFTPCETATLFDHLTDRGVTWAYFENRVSLMRAFTKYSFDMTNVRAFADPLVGFTATAGGLLKVNGVLGLPQVTFIDPLFGDLPAGVFEAAQDNDDAVPSDLQNGQKFINEIVQTLFTKRTNPAWQSTMLVIVYDEHGGFYDHVQPPDNATPLLGQNSGKLGPRVPAIVVSAYTPAGQAINDQFEHASIAATILRRFCSPFPPDMGPRVAAAADLRVALSLPVARGDATGLLPPPPTLPPVIVGHPRPITRFRAPTGKDDFQKFLGGLMMTSGSAP